MRKHGRFRELVENLTLFFDKMTSKKHVFHECPPTDRQGLLGTMASMLCAEAWWLWHLTGHLGELTGTRRCQEAQAVGVALDYRKLDEIDPSTRQRFFLQKVESDLSLMSLRFHSNYCRK